MSAQPRKRSGRGEVESELAYAIGEAKASNPDEVRAIANRDGGDGDKGPTVAQQLVALAEERYRFGRSLEGRAFAVLRDGANLARELSKSLDSELGALFYDRTGKVAHAAARNDAKAVLLGYAERAAPEPLALRVAQPEPYRIVIDSGRENGSAVEVTPDGWEVLKCSPVLFRRTALTRPFPRPSRAGDVSELRALLNVDDETFDLLIAWCVAAFFPDIDHAVVLFNGEPGSAKSVATSFLVQLIDPSVPITRRAPKDETAWSVAAAGSWVVALENVSSLQGWLSDSICRAVTRDGDVRRKLYSDDGLHVEQFRRVVVVNGIEVGGIRGDLADRLLIADLARIPDSKRKKRADIEGDFTRAWPVIFGGLLDVLAAVLKIRAQGRDELADLPRLADFAQVLRAVDLVRGSHSLDTFLDRAGKAQADLAENDAVTHALEGLLAERARNGRVRLTAADLLEELRAHMPPGDRTWPRTPRVLSQRLKLLSLALRGGGWKVEHIKSGDRKFWDITRSAPVTEAEQ